MSQDKNLKDAFYGANFRVGQGLLTRDKSTDSNDLTEAEFENIQTWDELTDQTATDEAFDELTESFQSCKDMAGSRTGITNVLDKNDTAFDLLTDKEEGMDGVTEVELGMDIITDREDSMDKVTDKEMPMDKVTDKPMALGKFFNSSHIVTTLWSQDFGSQELWKNGSIEPVTTQNLLTWEFADNEDGGSALRANGELEQDEKQTWEIDIEVTDYDTLKITTSYSGDSPNYIIELGSTTLFEDNSEFTNEERTFDISGETGVKTLKLGGEERDFGTRDFDGEWTNIILEE